MMKKAAKKENSDDDDDYDFKPAAKAGASKARKVSDSKKKPAAAVPTATKVEIKDEDSDGGWAGVRANVMRQATCMVYPHPFGWKWDDRKFEDLKMICRACAAECKKQDDVAVREIWADLPTLTGVGTIPGWGN